MKRLKKYWAKLRKLLLMSWYTLFFYKPILKEHWILIDSKNGKDLGSNLLRIAEELAHNPDYRCYKVFISCNKGKKKEIRKMIETYQLKNAKLIKENGFRYARRAGMVKYIFTDTSLPLWFVKKEGQVITNTWHGTPLKMMGKDVGNRAYDMGNVQKNHLISDYLIYPSDYMKNIMVSAYFLDNLYQGKILCSGYPRNSIFFNKERGEALREKLGLKGMRVYTYMPTWRGVFKGIDSEKNTNQLEYFFVYMDERLEDNEIFYVRLHPFIQDAIDYSQYKHIKPFPKGYEPYDILNLCDCMVTDYSSVLFDFANAGKKIVLFVYDREFYMDERGVYVSIDSFPFPQVRRAKEVLRELRTEKNYDDTEFRQKFCQYDGENTAEKLCRHIIKNEKVFEESNVKHNGKENVLIYSGSLAKSGLTSALLNVLANIDLEKRNYYICFRSASLKRAPQRLELLPEGVGFLPISSMAGKTLGEVICTKRYFDRNISTPRVLKKVDRFFARLHQRNFGEVKFAFEIHYHGYEKEMINMLLHSKGKNIIFVHNDMQQEINSKGNQHELTLRRAYHNYYRVVPVTKDIYQSTYEIGGNRDNIQVVNNCHDYLAVIEKSKQQIIFDTDTLSTVQADELLKILETKSKKFVTIGRFSPEKGHSMLIKAFNQYYKTNSDAYLIIIGGYGKLYQQTVEEANASEAHKNIIIIKSISNPMPILKRCDLFILSSLYEGLGLVILEADTLGVPVISTDIVGPQGFMREHGGYLVEPSVEGIYSGMKAFDEGKVPVMNVDYREYNSHSAEQFESLFKGGNV